MKDTATPTKKEGTPAQVMVDAYSKLVNLEGEQAFITLCVKRLKANTSSVRDIQASIVKAGGNAPTIRKSHVQYFLAMQEIYDKHPSAKSDHQQTRYYLQRCHDCLTDQENEFGLRSYCR